MLLDKRVSLTATLQLMDSNFFGAVALTQALLPTFVKQKEGRIVATSSVAGKYLFAQLATEKREVVVGRGIEIDALTLLREDPDRFHAMPTEITMKQFLNKQH
ncbi:unnamed protein product [Sphagnum balticum]